MITEEEVAALVRGIEPLWKHEGITEQKIASLASLCEREVVRVAALSYELHPAAVAHRLLVALAKRIKAADQRLALLTAWNIDFHKPDLLLGKRREDRGTEDHTRRKQEKEALDTVARAFLGLRPDSPELADLLDEGARATSRPLSVTALASRPFAESGMFLPSGSGVRPTRLELIFKIHSPEYVEATALFTAVAEKDTVSIRYDKRTVFNRLLPHAMRRALIWTSFHSGRYRTIHALDTAVFDPPLRAGENAKVIMGDTIWHADPQPFMRRVCQAGILSAFPHVPLRITVVFGLAESLPEPDLESVRFVATPRDNGKVSTTTVRPREETAGSFRWAVYRQEVDDVEAYATYELTWEWREEAEHRGAGGRARPSR